MIIYTSKQLATLNAATTKRNKVANNIVVPVSVGIRCSMYF